MARNGATPAVDELPLDVAQVLDEEYRVLYEGEKAPLPLPGWTLTEAQILDAGSLVKRLRAPSRVGRYFVARLPEETRQALASGLAVAPPLVARLVDGLNHLLTSDQLLYDEESLADVRLDPELQSLVALRLTGEHRTHVNRVLLERAFPGAIARAYDVRLRAFYERVHARARRPPDAGGADPRHTALCLSGGGIRSATFALGVMQGLARVGYLERFDYLSTVSGGGYVGAWLTTWIHRHPGGTPGVVKELNTVGASSPLMPEPKPVHHLREYSNYLSPRLGLLSADTWTLGGIYLRNLLLNWTVLIPFLLGVLAAPRLAVAVALAEPGPGWRNVVLGLGVLALFFSVVYIGLFRPSHEEARRRLPPWLRHRGTQEDVLLLCLTPLLFCAMAFTTYWAWSVPPPPNVVLKLVALGTGIHVAAWITHSWLLGRFYPGELVVSILTGALAGAIVGVTATRMLPATPVWAFVEYYVPLAVPAFIGAFLLAATVFVGLTSDRTSDEDREWWARLGAWALIVSVGWMIGSALVILGPPALAYSWTRLLSSLSLGTVAGLVAVLLGRSGKTSAAGTAKTPTAGAASWVMDHAATVAAPIALIVLLVLLSRATTALLPLFVRLLWRITAALLPLPAVPACTNWPVVNAPLPMLLDRIAHGDALHCTPRWAIAAWMAVLLGGAIWASRYINVNKFSLHAMYRARLIRAYLGASRGRRNPNPFTGFDPLDNVQMHELRDEAFNAGSFKDLIAFVGRLQSAADPMSAALRTHLSEETQVMLDAHPAGTEPSSTMERELLEDLNRILDTVALEDDPAFLPFVPGPPAADAWRGQNGPRRNRALLDAAYATEIVPRRPPPRKPLHVLNMALNLVAGRKLAWQERKAETFTVSELHAGSYHLGYRRASNYGGKDPRGISLGTAVAISGAAASPNMGYHSSPVVTFLMSMFNARLGWWLGNPGPRGHDTFRDNSPSLSLGPVLREAFGLTDDQYEYVYLSDGGHFDNLGLLEMVLRRCHFIVVSDAGCDPRCAFEDLGNAIRKIRIDLGVPITIRHQMRIRPRAPEGAGPAADEGAYFAVADIKYTAVDPAAVDGVIIYLKPSFYGVEPVDVLNYAVSHVTFPHETTADQFFSESQFESYRQLGEYTITRVTGRSA